MERLTKWVDGEPVENHDNDTSVEDWNTTLPENRFRNGYNNCMRKLAEYEDLQERGQIFDFVEMAKIAMMQIELKKYKDAEAEGRLIVLPCKVGDTVYRICPINLNIKMGDMVDGKVVKHNCERCAWGRSGCVGISQCPTTIVTELTNRSERWIWEYRADFGKTVFLSPEEAEAALAERLKGEINNHENY